MDEMIDSSNYRVIIKKGIIIYKHTVCKSQHRIKAQDIQVHELKKAKVNITSYSQPAIAN